MSPDPISSRSLTPAAPAQPEKRERLKHAADDLNQGLGMDGFVQDATRASSLMARDASLGAKMLRVAADFTNGEGQAVEHAVTRTQSATHTAAAALSSKLVPAVDRTVAPALSTAGKIFKFASKWAQVAALPFAAIDVREAIITKEPREKRQAIANATLSVAGGVAGAIGGFAYATPVGLPLLIISSVSGLFQILDHFAFKGQGTAWLGEHVVKPLQGVKSAPRA